jgi:hypothetical protein
MGLVLTVTGGMAIWIVVWALGAKSFDAFMITTLVIVLGAATRMLVPYLPGRRR